MDLVTLEVMEPIILRGYAQYNRGERVALPLERATELIVEYPECFKEVRQDDETKALDAPPTHKMLKGPKHKK